MSHDPDDTPEAREAVLRQDGILVGILGLGLLNGLSNSPFFDPMMFLLRPFAPGFFLSPVVLLYLTSLLISTFTIMLAGVPAALYERANGQGSSSTSMGIWLVGVIVLSLPTMLKMGGMLG